MVLLEYVRRTHQPTRVGNALLRIHDDGAVFAQVNRTEPPPGREWSEALEEPVLLLEDAARRIRELLQADGFFTLEPRYVDPARKGGTEEVLIYRGEGGERSVLVDRAQVAPFRALVSDLLWTLGLAEQLS